MKSWHVRSEEGPGGWSSWSGAENLTSVTREVTHGWFRLQGLPNALIRITSSRWCHQQQRLLQFLGLVHHPWNPLLLSHERLPTDLSAGNSGRFPNSNGSCRRTGSYRCWLGTAVARGDVTVQRDRTTPEWTCLSSRVAHHSPCGLWTGSISVARELEGQASMKTWIFS